MPVLQRSLRIRLARAHAVLSDGRQPTPSIAMLARDVALSRAHFMRRFRSVFGESALQLSVRERLRHARLLLATTEESVTDICMRIGYTSPATFSLLFKRQFAESPAHYRRRFWAVGCVREEVKRNLQPGCMTLFERAWASAPGHFSISATSPAMPDLPNLNPDPEHA